MPTPILVLVLTSSFFQEMAMPDTKANKPKKIIKKKKHLRIVNVRKKFVKAITIIKYILNLKVNLIIGILLTSAPAFKKQLTKTITKDKAVQF